MLTVTVTVDGGIVLRPAHTPGYGSNYRDNYSDERIKALLKDDEATPEQIAEVRALFVAPKERFGSPSGKKPGIPKDRPVFDRPYAEEAVKQQRE